MLSESTFKDLGLRDELVSATGQRGYKKASVVQEKCIPWLIDKEKTPNLIAQAPSGQGKTATFVLSALQIMLDKAPKNAKGEPQVEQKPLVVIVSHNHALTRQSCEIANSTIIDADLGDYGVNPPKRVTPDPKDREFDVHSDENLTRLQKVPQIVCGPPKQIEKVVKTFGRDILVVVFDEADEIIQQEDGKNNQARSTEQACKDIVKRCTKAQITLFSATFPQRAQRVADQLTSMHKGSQPNRRTERLLAEEQSVASIVQCVLRTDFDDHHKKLEILHQLVSEINLGQIIIFAKKIVDIDNEIVPFLHRKGISVQAHHNKIMKEGRGDLGKIEQDFKDKHFRVLVCTDQLARGFDPVGVGLVVQYDMPFKGGDAKPIETYQHRVGRTGRAGSDGVALCFLNNSNRTELEVFKEIKETYGQVITELKEDTCVPHIKHLLDNIYNQK